MARVAYIRTSTDHQDIAMQRHALAATGSFDREFVDAGVSGRRASRPALDEMRSWVRDGDEVVVYSLSRLGRSTIDLLTLMQDLDSRGVKVTSLSEQLDTSTPAGRLVLTVLAAVGEMEVAQTRERTMAGLAAARAEGRVGGRPGVPAAKLDELKRLVADGATITAAARQVGVGRSTAYRLLAS